MLQLMMFFSFVAAMLFFYTIIKFMTGQKKVINRLKKYTLVEKSREEKRKTGKREFKTGMEFISRGIGSIRFLDGYKQSVQFKLNRAQVLLKAEEYITIRVVLLFTTGIAIFLSTKSISFSLLCSAAGWIVPGYMLKVRINKRIKSLDEQLGDAIVLISNSLKAGYGFFQAIDMVAKEMTDPISVEFSLLQKEINLGQTTEKALENLVNRVGSDDLELVITAVLIQRQIGGNLAEVLDNISSTIRDRVKIKGEVRTLTAQGRVSGLIISLLPLTLGIIIFLISPDHISILFTHPLGLAIVIFSVIMELIGISLIRRIIKIEM